jgi:adenylate cyclase
MTVRPKRKVNRKHLRSKRRLMAVVVADAVAYSAAMHSNEERAKRAIVSKLKFLESRVGVFRGRMIGHTGDGILAIFESLVDAVKFGVETQKALAPLEGVEPALPFRFAVTVGDIILEGDRIFGDCVNIAARIQALAEPDAVSITRPVYEQVRFQLHYGYEFLGPKSLKNISDPIDVFLVRPEVGAVTALPSQRSPVAGKNEIWEELFRRPSVAVMPFRNRSGDSSQDFFADGLTEDIITNLSRFKALSVIARASTFALKEQQLPLEEYSRRLGVRYVVEGSFQKIDTRVRIIVHLFDGTEHKELWSERYDRDIEKIFEIQDEITAIATSAMAVQIEASERARLKAVSPPSFVAYGLVLQGQSHLFKYTRQDNIQARDFYVQGLGRNNHYSRALAALSRTHNLDWRYGWSNSPEQSLDLAQQCALSAVDADPSDARGHAELGYVRLYKKQHDPSIDAYKRAVTLNPNDANILMEYADTLTHAGQAGEAVGLFRKAMRLNPYYPDDYLWALSGAYFKLGDYEQSIATIQLMNNPAQGRRIMAAALGLLGRVDEARAQADLVRQTQPEFDAVKWAAIVPDKRPEDVLKFIEGLRIAGL